jgi:hypothetical protein
MQFEFTVDTLEQKGFDDFIFVSIVPKNKKSDEETFSEGPFLVTNCRGYIVAVHRGGRSIYRLGGFAKNDFASFVQSLKLNGYKNVNSRGSFIRHYEVDGIDLGCLFSATKSLSIDKTKYPCLIRCGELVLAH